MSRRNRFIVIGVLVLLGLGLAMLPFLGEDNVLAPSYSLGKLERGGIKAEVSATGTLSPVITVQVGSQVSGTIQHLDADFNSQVTKGQVIAQIDPAIYQARLTEAEANVRSSKAARAKAAVVVQETANNLKRVSNLFDRKLVSADQLDTARFAHDGAVAEQQIRDAAVAQAEAALLREQVNLAYTTIYAPIDGVVISRDVDVGQTVAASLQAPTLFTIAQNLAQMQIETDVDEAFIGMIKEQQAVTFSVFAYQERRFKGSVSQVRLQPKVEAGVVKYNCIIHVDNADLALKPGMTATVAIEVARKPDVFKVPNSALRFVPDWPEQRLKEIRTRLEPNEAFLWLPEGHDFKPIKVKTGIIGERETEVSADGLQEDMDIVMPPKRNGSSQKRRIGLSLF